MIALLQRVTNARVEVEGLKVGSIEGGVLGLIGVVPSDSPQSAKRLAERILSYRIFADGAGKMNLSVSDAGGGVLLVPQFTLAADTRSGTRPGFSTAASAAHAGALFEELVRQVRGAHPATQVGQFGAHMHVTLTNDGPVTFWLES